MSSRKINPNQNIIGKEIQGSKYSNVLKLINWYNSLNKFNYESPFEKHLLYSKQNVNDSTLEDLITSFLKSISSNLEYDELDFIKDFIREEVLKIKGEKISLSDLRRINFEKHRFDKSKIKIDDREIELNQIKYYEFGTEEAIRYMDYKDVTNSSNNEYLYSNGELLVAIPSILEKSIEIINEKDSKYDKATTITETSIVNDPYYLQAINKIKCQSDVSEHEANRRLLSFLKEINPKYYEVLIKIIASYKTFEEEEIKSFVEAIANKIDKNNNLECYFPLKIKEDDNGLHQILFNKYKDLFDRHSDREKRILIDYKKINDDVKIDELVFISDIGISGTQFVNTIKNYQQSISKKHQYNLKPGKFNEKLHNCAKISIINCLYTDLFEEKVNNFILNELGYAGEIEFVGVKINYKEYLFAEKIGIKKRHLELFREFVEEYYSKSGIKVNGKSYLEYIATIELEDPTNMLIARYKSMPKYHHRIFTLNTAIFKYRVDR